MKYMACIGLVNAGENYVPFKPYYYIHVVFDSPTENEKTMKRNIRHALTTTCDEHYDNYRGVIASSLLKARWERIACVYSPIEYYDVMDEDLEYNSCIPLGFKEWSE